METAVACSYKRTIVRVIHGDSRDADAAATCDAPGSGSFRRVIRLADGARVAIRPIRPDDEPRLVALFSRLSPRTVYQRFFRTYRELPAPWYRTFANVDSRTRLALVVEHHDDVVGVARYEPGDVPGIAEIAMVIEDAWQGRGLGTVLLGDVMRAGQSAGITAFSADVLADNERMLRLLRKLTRFTSVEVSQGVATMRFVPRDVSGTDGQGAPSVAS